jgi:hypothetical protein
MPNAAAFAELIRVLEQAVQAGVTSLCLEYEDRELIVYYRSGSLGVGADRIADDLKAAVIEEIVNRARLGRKSKGKMPVEFQKRQFDVLVEQHESFGEPVFDLTMTERRSKSGS